MPKGSFKGLTAGAVTVYTPALSIRPTAEQSQAVDLFKSGGSLAIQAGAGTGKTKVLQMIAESTNRKGQYTAFNKSIVEDAAKKMPKNIECNTAHSIAFGKMGWKYAKRFKAASPPLGEVAKKLGIKAITIQTPFSNYTKLLEPWRLTGYVRGAVLKYCQSADKGIGTQHFHYIEGIDEPGNPENNNIISKALLEPARRFWVDWQNPDGVFRYDQSAYLKLFELMSPRIDKDFILVDEAADLSGVMISIIEKQKHAQKIFVGDSAQAINEWMGAIDALERVTVENHCTLSHSFRFGQPVADVANRLLQRLGLSMQLTGSDNIKSEVKRLLHPKAILSRSNAYAVEAVLQAPTTSHLMGGTKDVINLVEELEKFRLGTKSSHHDLVMLYDYAEIRTYSESGHSRELELMVTLEAQHTGTKMAKALRQMPSAEDAERIYSTTHKVKGLEFKSVQIAPDFQSALTPRCVCDHTVKSHVNIGAGPICLGCDDQGKKCVHADSPVVKPVRPAEIRLAYVGVTRAQNELDVTAIEELID